MIIKKLPLTNIEKIYHVADIHIRLYKRHKEYKKVFDELKKTIQLDTKNAVLYIAGDTVHSKNDMSPEMISILHKFLVDMASVIPVIIILGNHDLTINNLDRLDAIKPIIDLIHHKNIFFLRETGIYQTDNIDFVVWSLLDKTIVTPEQCRPEATKILLYHDLINNSLKSNTNSIIELKNEQVFVSDFDNFDYVMLGDVHGHQILQEHKIVNGVIKPCVAYPGSLISQNHGEIGQHGIIKWDLVNGTNEFIEIKNEYTYVTININSQEDLLTIPELPKHPRVRLLVNQLILQVDLNSYISKLKKKYDVQELSINRIDNDFTFNLQQTNRLEQIRDVTFQEQLIEDFLKQNVTITELDILNIKQLHRDNISKISLKENEIGCTWKPLTLEFSNMFSYGENNIINFEDFHSLVGFFGSNAKGKSSLISTILFAAFDKTERGTKPQDIVNKNKDWLTTKFRILLNNNVYVIYRYTVLKEHRVANKIVEKVDFYIENEDGSVNTLLNGKNRYETDSIIEDYIGTYDNFILTNVALQNKNFGFIEKAQYERKDILMGFIGLNFFEQLYQSNLDILRDLDNKVGNLESYISKTNKYSDVNELKLKIEELNTSYNKKEKLIGELTDTLQQYNNEIIEYKSKIVVDCLIDNIDIDSNEDQLIKIKKQISSNTKKEQEIQDKTEEKNKRIVDIKYNLSIAGDIDKLKTEETELNAILLKKQQYEKEIETKKVDLKHKIKKMNQLGQLEYDINCKYCMNNIFVKDAIETKKQYATDKEKYNVTLSKYNDIINNLKSYDLVPVKIKNIEDLNKKKIELNTEIFKLDQEKIKLQNSTLDLNNSKITIEKTIERYNNNLFQIEENKRLNIKISDIQLNINNLNNKIQKIQKEYTVLYSEINLLKQNLIDIEKANSELHELLEQQKLHDLYSIVVKRDGLPYSLLNIIVPQIELLTNNILNQLTNFHFIMKLEDGGIDMRISYDNNTSWSVDLISGMEKFLLSVAVRIALANYSSLSKTNFLIIDEGFGNLDSDNVNSLVQLFEYLKTMFDWVFIVSHLTTIRDMVDSALEVRKDGLYSTLYMN